SQHRTCAGLYLAREPPKTRGELERVDTELGPEAGWAQVMFAAVAAILPNRRRAAQRHEVRFARRHSDTRKHANRRAFGPRRFAAGDTRQRADECLMLTQERMVR